MLLPGRCELLLNLGAKINASNNAGDRPWHFARNLGQKDVMEFLEKVGSLCVKWSCSRDARTAQPWCQCKEATSQRRYWLVAGDPVR